MGRADFFDDHPYFVHVARICDIHPPATGGSFRNGHNIDPHERMEYPSVALEVKIEVSR